MLSSRTDLAILLEKVSSQYVSKVEKIGDYRYLNVRSTEISSLGECACLRTNVFNRKMNSRRVDIEKRVFQYTQKYLPFNANPLLNYLSLGAGLLLQDFIICAGLLLRGYSLCVRLIETSSTEREFQKAYRQFCCLQQYARGMGYEFDIVYFENIMDYIREYPLEQVDVGLAIDFDNYCFDDDAKMDLYLSYKKLAENGFFYVAFLGSDFIFTPYSYSCLRYSFDTAEQGKKFFKASEIVENTEQQVARAMDILPSHITKHVIGYVGLFDVKEAVKPQEKLHVAREVCGGVVARAAKPWHI